MYLLRICAWGIVFGGWLCFVAALLCPAIDYRPEITLDLGSVSQMKRGWECWIEALNPVGWIVAPLTLIYVIANCAMLLSFVAVLPSPSSRPVFATILMPIALVNLTAPFLPGVDRIHIGCILWIVSFFSVAIGCLILAENEPLMNR